MTTSATIRRPRAAAAARTRKSPLRTATLAVPADLTAGLSAADVLLAAGRDPRDPMPAPELRRMQISEFAEGVRRMELIQLELPDLSADLIARPFVRVMPLKSACAFTEGRIVPLTAATSRSVASYLRIRRSHRLAASSSALWLGTRNRGPLTGSGLYRMLKRCAAQAGYEPDVHPHQFRHTFANDWLAGDGAEGDLMRLMGWTDRSMLDLVRRGHAAATRHRRQTPPRRPLLTSGGICDDNHCPRRHGRPRRTVAVPGITGHARRNYKAVKVVPSCH